MAEIRIDINARDSGAKRELSALQNEIKDTREAADELSDRLDKAADASSGASKGFKVAGLSLTDLKSGLDLAGQGLEILKQGWDATVAKAAQWGDDMGDLAQVTGQSVEATSEMAATLELLGIKSENLGTVIKTMTKSGLQLNLATLKQLSAEYQAIQDPVKQNEFLFKKFGKAGIDMAEVLGKSTEELERFSAAARTSGKVIDEATADAAENLNVELAILQQKAEGLAIAIGNKLIPAINDFIDATDDGKQAMLRGQGAVVEIKKKNEELGLALIDLERNQMESARAAAELEVANLAQGRAADSARLAAMALAVEQANNKAAADDLAFGMRELTTQVLFNEAAAGLDSQAALELARAMGLVNEDAIRTQDALENLKKKYDLNRDGTVSATEATQGYIDAVRVLQNNIERLQDKKVTVTTEFITVGNPATDLGNLRNNQRAAGGPVTGGVPYLVGERGPEIFVPGQGGMIIPNSQINMGGVNMTVNGAGDPRAVALAIRAELENMGRRADARART